MINITFPDGTTKAYNEGITSLEIAEQISSGVQDLFSEKFDCQTTIIKNGLSKSERRNRERNG